MADRIEQIGSLTSSPGPPDPCSLTHIHLQTSTQTHRPRTRSNTCNPGSRRCPVPCHAWATRPHLVPGVHNTAIAAEGHNGVLPCCNLRHKAAPAECCAVPRICWDRQVLQASLQSCCISQHCVLSSKPVHARTRHSAPAAGRGVPFITSKAPASSTRQSAHLHNGHISWQRLCHGRS